MQIYDQTRPLADAQATRPPLRLDPIFAALALALIFALALIGASAVSGRLSLPPTYDDITYFNDALRRLDLLSREGVAALWRDYCDKAPHSPFSTLTAMAGFAAFGVNLWAPYIASGFILAAFLSILLMVLRAFPTWASLGLAMVLLTHPFSTLLIVHFRPDMVCGLLTALGTLAILWLPWAEGDRRTVAIVGLLLGAALLTKPSVVHVTLLLFGLAMLLSATPRLAQPETRRHVIEIGAATLAIAALVGLPYYAFGWRHVMNYIYVNTLGSQAHIWNVKLSFSEHALYYLTGDGGAVATGHWLYIWLIAAAAAFFLAPQSTRPKLWRTAAVIIACYLTVSIPAHKSPFIGVSLSAYLLVTLTAMMAAASHFLLQRGRRAVLLLALCALVLGGIFDLGPALRLREGVVVAPAYAETQWRVLNEVADVIAPVAKKGGLMQTAISQYLSGGQLSYVLWRRGVIPPRVIDCHRCEDPSMYRERMNEAGLALAFDPDYEYELLRGLPSYSLARSFLEDLRADPTFTLAATVKDAKGADTVYVFVRK